MNSSDIQNVNELRNGSGIYEFDYLVNAVKKGFEDYQVVRNTVDSVSVGKGYENYRVIQVKTKLCP